MTSRELQDAWTPTAENIAVIDCLALGYSVLASSRRTGISNDTITYWLREASFREKFRALVAERARLFIDNLEAIEVQQVVQATALVGAALAGELQRDKHGELPIEWLTATALLRSTRWKALSRVQYDKLADKRESKRARAVASGPDDADSAPAKAQAPEQLSKRAHTDAAPPIVEQP